MSDELERKLRELADEMANDRTSAHSSDIETRAAQAALLLARGLTPVEAHATGDETADAHNRLIMQKARTRNPHNQLRGLH